MNGVIVGLTGDGHLWWVNCDEIPNTQNLNVTKEFKMSQLTTNVDGNVLLGLNEANTNITYWSAPTNPESFSLALDNPGDVFCPSKLIKVATAQDHFIGLTEHGEVLVWKCTGRSSRMTEFNPKN